MILDERAKITDEVRLLIPLLGLIVDLTVNIRRG